MYTVIGIFEDSSHAGDARSYLLANGFETQDIDISVNGQTTAHADGEEDFSHQISKFFKNLFEDEDDSHAHIKAGGKGTVVTVHTQASREAQEALDVLNYYGAVDVKDFNERSPGDTLPLNEIPLPEEISPANDDKTDIRLRGRIVERKVDQNLRLR